jgi:hypothetical protein
MVRTEPSPTFFTLPSQWAVYMTSEARKLLSANLPATLTVAAGRSALTAVSLVEDELSRRALLINPDLPSASVAALDLPTRETANAMDLDRHRPPPAGVAVEPEARYRNQISEGNVGEEEAAYLIEVASEAQHLDALGDVERRLVEQIQTEQLARLLPLTLDADAGDQADDYDWLGVAVQHPQQCTVALSHALPHSKVVTELVHQKALTLPIVDLPVLTPYAWLEDPERIVALVDSMLHQ